MTATIGKGSGHVAAAEIARCQAIARRHGATFVSERGAYWFALEMQGAPFDYERTRALLREVGRVETSRHLVAVPPESER